MKRLYTTTLLVICLLLLGTTTLYGKNITLAQAQAIAYDFFARNSNIQVAQQDYYTPEYLNNTNSLYIFNNTQGEGFVVIAAEESMENKILGYSDTGEFDHDNIPPAMQWLLDNYEKEMAYMQQKGSDYTSAATTSQVFDKDVAPLIKTEWGQTYPYNNLCPQFNAEQRCVTGCVATAMAQVMYYHQWPVHGRGSNSYTTATNGYSLSANFSEATYRWDLMTTTYNEHSSAEACDAVALLMYHAGIATDMDYGLSSGAGTSTAAKVLVENFDYDKSLKFAHKKSYPTQEWELMIANSIDNNMPILYRGTSIDGGHAFVLDGYNSNGYVHINWGWDGHYNGYFVLSTLDPYGNGNGFKTDQAAVFFIQPNKGSTEYTYDIIAEEFVIDEHNYPIDTPIEFYISTLQHTNISTVYFKTSVAVYNNDGQIVHINPYWDCDLDPNYYYKEFYSTLDLSSLPEGSYYIEPVYSTDEATTWQRVKIDNNNIQTYYARVESDMIKISSQKPGEESIYLYPKERYPFEIYNEKVLLTMHDNKGYLSTTTDFTTDDIAGKYKALAPSAFQGYPDEEWEIEITRDASDNTKVWLHPLCIFGGLNAASIKPVYAIYDKAKGTLEMPLGQTLYGSENEEHNIVSATVDEVYNPLTTGTITFNIANNTFSRTITTDKMLGAGDINSNEWWYQALKSSTYSINVGIAVADIDSISTRLTLPTPQLTVSMPSTTDSQSFVITITSKYANKIAATLTNKYIDIDYKELLNGGYSAYIRETDVNGETLNVKGTVQGTTNYIYIAATNMAGEIVTWEGSIEYLNDTNTDKILGTYKATANSAFADYPDEEWNVTITADADISDRVWIQPFCMFGGLDADNIKSIYATYDESAQSLTIPLGQCLYGGVNSSYYMVLGATTDGSTIDTKGNIHMTVSFNPDGSARMASDAGVVIGVGNLNANEWWYQALHNIVFTNSQTPDTPTPDKPFFDNGTYTWNMGAAFNDDDRVNVTSATTFSYVAETDLSVIMGASYQGITCRQWSVTGLMQEMGLFNETYPFTLISYNDTREATPVERAIITNPETYYCPIGMIVMQDSQGTQIPIDICIGELSNNTVLMPQFTVSADGKSANFAGEQAILWYLYNDNAYLLGYIYDLTIAPAGSATAAPLRAKVKLLDNSAMVGQGTRLQLANPQ